MGRARPFDLKPQTIPAFDHEKVEFGTAVSGPEKAVFISSPKSSDDLLQDKALPGGAELGESPFYSKIHFYSILSKRNLALTWMTLCQYIFTKKPNYQKRYP